MASTRSEITNWPRYRCLNCGGDFDEAKTNASELPCCPDCNSSELVDHRPVAD